MISSFAINIVISLSVLGLCFFMISKLIEKSKEGNKKFLTASMPVVCKEFSTREQRSFERINYKIPVVIKNGEKSFQAVTKDISLRGAFVISNEKTDLNSELQINLFATFQKEAWFNAKVIWSNTNLPENKIIIPGFGIKFIKVKEKEKHLLTKLMDRIK